MRIAAIVPLHNKERYVAAALASILAQTRPVDEIIVVDDASTDEGAAIVAKLADPRLRLIRRETPGPGGYAARNLAIEASSADWVAFLDADDVWEPDHLAGLEQLALAFPDAGVAATRYRHVFRDREEPDTVAGPFAGDAAFRTDFAGFLRGWLNSGHCPIWTGAVAIRRDVLMRSGVFPAGKAARGGDKDLWLRAMRQTELAFLPRFTARFHREAEGKLTDRVGTRSLPCLVQTARDMQVDATAAERALLKRLINQEIELYARWTVRHGGRPSARLGDLVWPPALTSVITLAAARYAPSSWLRGAYQLEHRRRARRRAS